MSNCWRKLEQHDNNLEYTMADIIKPAIDDLPFVIKYHIYKGEIIPNTIVEKDKVYEIEEIHEMLILNGLYIETENDKVKRINLFGLHPNRDPDTGIYCLPDFKKNQLFTKDYFDNLVKTIQIYYLNDSYFHPGNHVIQKEIQSINISAQ